MSDDGQSNEIDMRNQWLYDRVNGQSRVGKTKPPCPCCWPPIFLKCCPSLLETNWFCRCIGRIGCVPSESEWARCFTMRLSCAINIYGFLLTFFAMLSLTEFFEIMKITSFSSGTLESDNPDFETVTVDIGVRAIAIENHVGEQVVGFKDLCGLAGNGLETYMRVEDCEKCHDVSQELIIALIVTAVTYIPSMMTSIVRLYSNYDVNCQKFFATILSILSLTGSLMAYWRYTSVCYNSFYQGEIPFAADGTVLNDLNDSNVSVIVNFEWKVGIGMFCLFAAAGLKFLDIFFNCCVPTPNLTRDAKLQREYENLPYPEAQRRIEQQQQEESNDENEP